MYVYLFIVFVLLSISLLLVVPLARWTFPTLLLWGPQGGCQLCFLGPWLQDWSPSWCCSGSEEMLLWFRLIPISLFSFPFLGSIYCLSAWLIFFPYLSLPSSSSSVVDHSLSFLIWVVLLQFHDLLMHRAQTLLRRRAFEGLSLVAVITAWRCGG